MSSHVEEETLVASPAPLAESPVSPAPRESSPTLARVVCHLIASNFLGGPEKQILEHCARLDRHRWRPVLGSFRENRERVEVVEAARERGIPVFLIDTRSPWNPHAVLQLRRRLREHGAEVLISHGYKPNVVGYLATLAGGPVQIPYVRGYTAETARVRRYEALDRRVLRRFPRVLCVSDGTRDTLANYGLDAGRLLTVHNAVETDTQLERADLRGEFGIPEGAGLLVAAGRLSAEKGHRFLVRAMARLKETPAPHVVIFGVGREAQNLSVLARSLGVEDRVHWGGFRRDLPSCLAAADLVVNPSETEGLPNVVLEAQALGLPVVATAVGGVPELITPGQTGWLVPPGDTEALAAAIREALADPGRARRLGAGARERTAQRFSFTAQSERLMGIYDAALA